MVCTDDQPVLSDEGKPTAMVMWDDPTASDNSGNVTHVTCDPMSGTNFTIGQTRVACEAVDGSGNDAECSFTVNVTGIYSDRRTGFKLNLVSVLAYIIRFWTIFIKSY